MSKKSGRSKKPMSEGETSMSPENLRRWAESPEGKKSLAEAQRRSQERSKAIRESGHVDWKLRHTKFRM